MSQQDSSNIKKSVLMRYPQSFLEECSRALIGHKSFKDNKQYYKCLPIIDSLIDYVTLDPVSRKRIYDMTEEEMTQSKHHFIPLPKDLVEDFRRFYHGPRNDSRLPLRFLSPGKSLDPAKGIVHIRRPVNFLHAWGRYEPEYIILKGGFYYTETKYQPTEMGMLPYEVKVPLIDFADPDLQYHECDTVPFAYWAEAYDKGWTEIGPICTMIEKIIAETLEHAGYHIERSNPTATQGAAEPDNEAERLQL
ncbi:MAG: hypothetical protein ACREAW_04720 [Nitrososphaera sp.]